MPQPVCVAPDAVAALDAWARSEATYHARILGVARTRARRPGGSGRGRLVHAQDEARHVLGADQWTRR